MISWLIYKTNACKLQESLKGNVHSVIQCIHNDYVSNLKPSTDVLFVTKKTPSEVCVHLKEVGQSTESWNHYSDLSHFKKGDSLQRSGHFLAKITETSTF